MSRNTLISESVTVAKAKTIVVVGAGAIGLLYGCRLLEAEQITGKGELDLNFICRRDFHYCSTHGFKMKSPDGDYFSGKGSSIFGKIHLDSSTISVPVDGVEWIICAVKSYSLQDDEGELLRKLIAPMIGRNSRILLIMNGLGCERLFCEWFGSKIVFVGMAFTCVNRNKPDICFSREFNLIDHIAFGALSIGHCENNIDELEIAKSLWSSTKISSKVTVATSLLHAQWSKLCWNIPFNGLSVALGGVTTDIIADDHDLRIIADRIMIDTISLANADILFHFEEDLLVQTTTATLERTTGGQKAGETLSDLAAIVAPKLINGDEIRSYCWALTDNMGPYKSSTVLDLINGNRLELEYLFNQPLERARAISTYRRAEGKCKVTSTAKSNVLPANYCDSCDGSRVGMKIEERTVSASTDTCGGGGKEEECITGATDWIHLETVVMQVTAMARIAAIKRKRGVQWTPTLISEIE